MSTAFFGGSFDPMHLGHLFVLHTVLNTTDYSRIIIIPAHISNFKQEKKPCVSDCDRLAIICAALKDFRDLYPNDDFSRISLSVCELERGGISYTSSTVRKIKDSLHCADRTGIIIGDDHLENLEGWHDFDYLRQNAEFIVCQRNNHQIWDRIPDGIVYRKISLEKTAPQSSSLFRADPDKMKDFLSPGVLKYVSSRGLYGIEKKCISNETDLCSYLKATVSEKRFRHSIGVASMTDKVMRRYGYKTDVWKGFQSATFCGLIHDLGREFPDEAVLFCCRENGDCLSEYETLHPVTAHGMMSVRLAISITGDFPLKWQDAVRNHTTGCGGMDELSLALFIADYIEPNRTFITDSDRDAILSCVSIEECALEVLSRMIRHWKEKNLDYNCPSTEEMLKDLLLRVKK